MSNNKRIILYWVPAVASMTAIFVVSSLHPETIEKASPLSISSAVAHLVEYAVLSILLSRLVLAHGRYSGASMWGIVLAVTVAYGFSDELHQSFVPGRVPSWVDILYNSFGAVIGVTVIDLAQRLLRSIDRVGLAVVVTGYQPDWTGTPDGPEALCIDSIQGHDIFSQ